MLRSAIASYYNTNYGCKIDPENVMIFSGGRSAIYSVMSFLKKHVQVRIGNVEWPAYLDILTQTSCDFKVVPFSKENNFHPPNSDYFDRSGLNAKTHIMPVISNPSNPTGHTRCGAELAELMEMAEQPKNGILLDEAYEWFHDGAVSGIQYVKDLENSNVFITGACTKGLQVSFSYQSSFQRKPFSHYYNTVSPPCSPPPFQCPGIRIGWVIASKKNISTLSNYSSFGMGGVSHPSQLYAVALLEPGRVSLAKKAVQDHYAFQRERYGKAFKPMGLKVYTGDGGFYHWLELPEGLNAKDLNKRLFARGAAVLCASDCDMARPHDKSEYTGPYDRFFRFSFGPLPIESFESDIQLFTEVLDEYKKAAGI